MSYLSLLPDRITERIQTSANEKGCWLWIGGTNGDGYGQVRFQGRQVSVHRMAYELTYGETELFVCHECDTPSCCNPEHLFPGTHQDNMDDKSKKGRNNRGVDQRLAKLTEEDVISIRVEYAAGGVTQQDLADKYSISRTSISLAVNYKSWKHIP